jgi:alpha-beta hydrolase superfamily lysophospholipase
MRSPHCSRAAVLILALLGSVRPSGQQPAATATSFTTSFLIYFRAQVIGREEVSVVQSPQGWTITSGGRTGGPVDLITRELQVRYTPDWKPLDLTIDATLRGQSLAGKTSIVGTEARSSYTQAGKPSELTDTVAADTIFLPSPLWGPFEALARRLRTAAAGTTLPAYTFQAAMGVEVGASHDELFQTTSRAIPARRTGVKIIGVGQPLDAQIWAEHTGRLLRISIPSQSLEVIREDIASVAVRHVPVRRPGDQTVRIPAVGFSLGATVSKPDVPAERLPAVILVGGSGQTDRDETGFGIPAMGQLANALADAGWIVIRYDKRGVGQSGGRAESAVLADYADDLMAAVKYARNRRDVDKKRVAVVAHSEGAPVAMLAARDDSIAAVALVGAMAVTGAELNLWRVQHELEQSNASEADRQKTIALQKSIQTAVLTDTGWDAIPPQYREQANTPWFKSFLAFDPEVTMKRVRQPVLVLQGLLDTQVPPLNADRFEQMVPRLKRKQPMKVVRVPGVNHLLVPAKTGEASEYPTLVDASISPAIIEALVSWLKPTFAAIR